MIFNRYNDELYRNVPVNVREGWTVKRSIEEFLKSEEIELNCEKCAGKSGYEEKEIIAWLVLFCIVYFVEEGNISTPLFAYLCIWQFERSSRALR